MVRHVGGDGRPAAVTAQEATGRRAEERHPGRDEGHKSFGQVTAQKEFLASRHI